MKFDHVCLKYLALYLLLVLSFCSISIVSWRVLILLCHSPRLYLSILYLCLRNEHTSWLCSIGKCSSVCCDLVAHVGWWELILSSSDYESCVKIGYSLPANKFIICTFLWKQLCMVWFVCWYSMHCDTLISIQPLLRVEFVKTQI